MSFYGYVYRITNLLNGKTYIGRHSPRNNESWSAYLGSGLYIRRSIEKHGKENFKKDLISEHSDFESLCIAEAKEIKNEIHLGKAEYNLYSKEIVTLTSSDEDLIIRHYINDLLTVDEISLKFSISKLRAISILKKHKVLRSRSESQKLRNPNDLTEIRFCKYCGVKFESKIKSKSFTCSKSCSGKLGYKRIDSTIKHNFKLSQSKRLKGNTNAKNKPNGGNTATHNRWHVKRNIKNDNCILCN